MGRENGTQPWIRYDDERAFLEQGELPEVIRELIGGRLAEKRFTLEILQNILLSEHGIPLQLKTLRGHVNACIDDGEVTIFRNGGGNGGSRIYQSQSIRRPPVLSVGEAEGLEFALTKQSEAELLFEMCRGRSNATIKARPPDVD